MQTLSRIPAHAAGTLLRSRIACSVRSSHIKSIHTTKLPSQPEQPSRVPQLVKPSLWQILLPKVWRRDSVTTTVQSDGTNTVFLVLIFIAIGSQAMQLADVRRDMLELTLMTNSKLTLLKDVIARIGRGEEVDVGKVLGTSHPRPEIEWEEGLSGSMGTRVPSGLTQSSYARTGERAQSSRGHQVTDRPSSWRSFQRSVNQEP